MRKLVSGLVLILCAFAAGAQVQPHPASGNQISSVSGNGHTVVTTNGPLTPGHGAVADANGNLVDSGSSANGAGLAYPIVTVTLTGTPGTTEYSYCAVGTDSTGGTRSVCAQTFTGNATLSGTNFNTVNVPAWNTVAPFFAPVGSCSVYRMLGGATAGVIGTIASCSAGGTLADTGLSGDSTSPAVDSSGIDASAGPSNSQTPNVSSKYGNTVCALGDSLVVLNGTDIQYGPNFLQAAVLLSNGKLQLVHDGGVAGQTSTQVLARVYTDAVSQPCGIVVVTGPGTNDTSGSIAIATTEANDLAIYKAIVASGKLLVVTTIPPRSGNDAFVSALNPWIKKQAQLLNVPLTDFYATVVNPSTGLYQAACLGDGVHPYLSCVRTVAQQLLTDISGYLPSHHPLIPLENADPNNLISNGTLLTTSSISPCGAGGTSGTFATGWACSSVHGNTGFSITTNASTVGNVIQMTKSTSTAGDNDVASLTATLALTAGHKYAFTGRIATTNAEAGTLIYTLVLDTFSTGFATVPIAITPVFGWTGTDIPSGQWYIEFICPPGVAFVSPSLTLQTGTGTVQIGQIGLYDLTALGAN